MHATRGRIVIALAALVALGAAAAAAAPFDPVAGAWRGQEAQGAGLEPADLDMRLRAIENGFELSWSQFGPTGRERTTVAFLATDRPGVYAAGKGGGWLFGMFGGSAAPGNPLKGQVLRWARAEPEALIVYRLDVHEDGGYMLDRYSWRLQAGGLTFAYERRTDDAPVDGAKGRLARADDGR